MRRRAHAYLELVRVFLTPTAVSNSLAGFLAAESLRRDPGGAPTHHLVLASLLSVLAYWLGMAANDLFDRYRDAVNQRAKPLPSGRLGVNETRVFCTLLTLGVLLCGFQLGIPGLTLALLGAIAAYDAGGKNVPWVGNGLMGLCRAINFLVGAAAALGAREALQTPALLAAAAALGGFIAVVTAVSRLEDEAFSSRRLAARAAPAFALPAFLAILRWRDPVAILNALALLLLLADALRAARRAGRSGKSRIHGAALFVRKSLAGVFLVDCGLLLVLVPDGAATLHLAAIFWGLYALGELWKQAWIRRGSAGS